MHDRHLLTRYFFERRTGFGYGVSAYSEQDAVDLLAAAQLEISDIVHVIANVDMSTLDQKHVVPNIGPPSFRGVWFPRLNV
jgi:hypothetical protein